MYMNKVLLVRVWCVDISTKSIWCVFGALIFELSLLGAY